MSCKRHPRNCCSFQQVTGCGSHCNNPRRVQSLGKCLYFIQIFIFIARDQVLPRSYFLGCSGLRYAFSSHSHLRHSFTCELYLTYIQRESEAEHFTSIPSQHKPGPRGNKPALICNFNVLMRNNK